MHQTSTLKSWNGAHLSSASTESPPSGGKEHDGIIEALTSSWHNDSLIHVSPAEKLDGLAPFQRNPTSPADIPYSASENQAEITTDTHSDSVQLENLNARMPAASISTEHVRSLRHSPDRVSPESSQMRPNHEGPLLSLDTVRDLVLPLLLKNVTLRGGRDHSSETILQATNKVLSEDACQNIALQMAEAQRQLSQARVLDTRSMAGNRDSNGDVVIARSGSPQSIRVSNSPTVVNGASPQANERERSNSLGIGHVNGEDVQSSDWIPLKRRRLDLDSRYSSEHLSHQHLVSPTPLQQSSVKDSIPSEAINGVTPYPHHSHLNGNGLHSESFRDSPVPSHSHLPTQTPQINGSSSIHHSLSPLSYSPHDKIPPISHARPSPATEPTIPSHFSVSHTTPNSIENQSIQPVQSTASHSSSLPSSQGEQDMDCSPEPLNSCQLPQEQFHSAEGLNESEAAISSPSTAISVPQVPLCHHVPGVWGIGLSLTKPGILEFTVDIDLETAQKWNIKSDSDLGDSVEFVAPVNDQKLAVHLLCLPLEVVASTYQNIEWMSHHSWPAQGSLLVDVNHTKSHGRSWLPHFFAEDNGPLNITDAIQLGKNTIRCIQLSSLKHLFAIHASISCTEAEVPATTKVEEEPPVINEALFDRRASEEMDNTPIDTHPSEEFKIDIKVDYG